MPVIHASELAEDIGFQLEGSPTPITLPRNWRISTQRLLNCNFDPEMVIKPHQWEAMKEIMERRDVFVKLPTGSGKSLCYQLAAEKDAYGLTIVISPLRALIEDQCRALRKQHVNVVWFHGDQTIEERHRMKNKMFAKTTVLCYVTPETFFAPYFLSMVTTLAYRARLSRFVIDEAHCVFEYGPHFRLMYRKLGDLRLLFPKIPIVALTATMRAEHLRETISILRMNGCVIVGQSIDRPNLRYSVFWRSDHIGSALIRLFAVLDGRDDQTGIIYCHKKERCEFLVKSLNERNIGAKVYHAGLSADERKKRFREWKDGHIETRILVATIALGMGIDHPCVRFVIHWDIPMSIDAYIQESGRAGRDGQPADCIMFFMPRLWQQSFLIASGSSGTDDVYRQQLKHQLLDVNEYCVSGLCRRNVLLSFMGEAKPKGVCGTCDNCISTRSIYDMTAICATIVRLIKEIRVQRHLFGIHGAITRRKLVGLYLGHKNEGTFPFRPFECLGDVGPAGSQGQMELVIDRLLHEEILAEQLVFHRPKGMKSQKHYFDLDLGPNAEAVLNGHVVWMEFTVIRSPMAKKMRIPRRGGGIQK